MRTRLLPYRAGSSSARDIADRLDVKRLRLGRTLYRPKVGDVIINWGNHQPPLSIMARGWAARWVNDWHAVERARDKLETLRLLTASHVPTVEWTDSHDTALGWHDGRTPIFARLTLTGQGGAGIVICVQDPPPAGAPLYTKQFRAMHEYRVHVCRGEVLVSKKRRRNGAKVHMIRNHENGYVFCTENVQAPEEVIEAGFAAVEALGLDFGAVDILAKTTGEVAVLEVNTAPGLEGKTLDWYAEQLGGYIPHGKKG